MITQILPNIIPPAAVNDGLAVMLDSSPMVAPSEIPENSICVCRCNYREMVFSETGAVTDWNKNDKTSLLFKKGITADTITIVLYRGTTSWTITDNTYGVYYPGTLTGQPLYWGFVADWNKIYNVLGAGEYRFETTLIILGAIFTITSIDYLLQPYSDRMADNTVRVETYNTGTILSSQFNYQGLLSGGWYQSYRIRGKLLPKIPRLITDTYTDQDNNIIQINDKITNDYELILHPIPAEIADQLIYDNLLANEIYVSDYNVYNEDVKRQVKLRPTEIEKKSYIRNTWLQFNIKLTSAKDDTIKNNY